MVAANIGGGILGLGYAFSRLGIYVGVLIVLFVATLAHLSNMLHMKTKDLTPRKYESVYEIAYLLVGRSSIFAVCIIMVSSTMSALVMYYIIIGDTVSTLLRQALLDTVEGGVEVEEVAVEAELDDESTFTNILCSKTFVVLTVGAFLTLIIFKRHIQELKVVSYFFIGIVFLFVTMMIVLAA